jgi:FtsH-binding integral membrane protein
MRRRRDIVRPLAIALALIAAGAATVVALAFALDAYASPGTWIVGVDVIIFLAVGVGVMRRGPRHLDVAAAIWVGLVSAALGLLDGAVFLHPIVLAILPGTVMRLLVVTAIGAGASAAVLGSTQFSEITAVAAADRVSW